MLFCLVPTGVSAISEGQKLAISENCTSIKESLKKTQQMDASTRVFFGNKFETILTKYITPLNVKLVEKNAIPNSALLENQSNFAEAKEVFRSDYIRYQQALEELVNIDCKVEPEGFYDQLLIVRERRKLMGQDVEKLKKLASQNVKLVTELRSGF